jgi:hypothetical protein
VIFQCLLNASDLTWRRRNLARFEAGQFSHYVFETLKTVVAEDDMRKFDKEGAVKPVDSAAMTLGPKSGIDRGRRKDESMPGEL